MTNAEQITEDKKALLTAVKEAAKEIVDDLKSTADEENSSLLVYDSFCGTISYSIMLTKCPPRADWTNENAEIYFVSFTPDGCIDVSYSKKLDGYVDPDNGRSLLQTTYTTRRENGAYIVEVPTKPILRVLKRDMLGLS